MLSSVSRQTKSSLSICRVTSSCTQMAGQSLRFMADSSQDADDEHKSSDTSDFVKNAVKAPVHEAKKAGEKIFGDRKTMSKQSMGPAGHMQGRNPDGDKAAQYDSLHKKKDAKWGEHSPTAHYKEDPQEPAVDSDPRSSDKADAARKDA